MTTQLRRITFLSRDPAALAQFWSRVLFRPVAHGPDGEQIPLVDGNQPQALHFQAAPAGVSSGAAVCLGIGPLSGSLAEEVGRIAALGATVVSERSEGNEPGCVAMADPEGNQFLVEASEEELLDLELGGGRAAGRPTA